LSNALANLVAIDDPHLFSAVEFGQRVERNPCTAQVERVFQCFFKRVGELRNVRNIRWLVRRFGVTVKGLSDDSSDAQDLVRRLCVRSLDMPVKGLAGLSLEAAEQEAHSLLQCADYRYRQPEALQVHRPSQSTGEAEIRRWRLKVRDADEGKGK
jgi:hypothetical protein